MPDKEKGGPLTVSSFFQRVDDALKLGYKAKHQRDITSLEENIMRMRTEMSQTTDVDKILSQSAHIIDSGEERRILASQSPEETSAFMALVRISEVVGQNQESLDHPLTLVNNPALIAVLQDALNQLSAAPPIPLEKPPTPSKRHYLPENIQSLVPADTPEKEEAYYWTLHYFTDTLKKQYPEFFRQISYKVKKRAMIDYDELVNKLPQLTVGEMQRLKLLRCTPRFAPRTRFISALVFQSHRRLLDSNVPLLSPEDINFNVALDTVVEEAEELKDQPLAQAIAERLPQ